MLHLYPLHGAIETAGDKTERGSAAGEAAGSGKPRRERRSSSGATKATGSGEARRERKSWSGAAEARHKR